MTRLTTKIILTALAACALASCSGKGIDREALVSRNNPHVVQPDTLSSLTVGNGAFAVTLDATGLQSFPEIYKNGLPLGTYSEWAWHSFPNTEGYTREQALREITVNGHESGIYAVQKGAGMTERDIEAAEWFRSNPHRLHLGNIGFEALDFAAISNVDQSLDMWNGVLVSNFDYEGSPVSVRSLSSGDRDLFAASVSAGKPMPVCFRFPYPTGAHADDASNWNADGSHSTEIIESHEGGATVRRTIDETVYYVNIAWEGKASLSQAGPNKLLLTPEENSFSFTADFLAEVPEAASISFAEAERSAKEMWNGYWKTTGIIDFSHCTDARAALLERRVILTQYLMRVQEAQSYPPAETGLTYNTWYGKYHLEMFMFHSFHYATWNKTDLAKKQLAWFKKAMPVARQIAERQGFEGIRWMKMTDPSTEETASDVGSFLLWQQPQPLYMAELIYRAEPSREFLEEYYELVQESAKFIADFLVYDESSDRYVILGVTGANESYDKKSTVNPALEMSFCHFALSVAQQWRERLGEERVPEWDEICDKLEPLATSPDGIYLPAKKGPGIPDFENMDEETASKIHVRATSSENLLAYGVLPECRLFNRDNMMLTLDRAEESWDWVHGSWSWNYPALAMNATRLLRPDVAVRAITMDDRDDLLLPSGNNYRTERLRMYMPGNGGLLLAVGMMCAGWDGCEVKNPGFPQDGSWDVRWEGLKPMP